MAGEIANSIGSFTEASALADTDMLEIERPDGSPPGTPNSWWRITALKIGNYVLGKVVAGSGMRLALAGGELTLESGGANIVEISTTTATFGLSHLNRSVKCNNASAQTLTIPPQASVAWPDNIQLEGWQHGAGAVTFAAGAGVTIRKSAKITLTTDGQYSPWGLKRIGTNEWLLFGAMVSA